MQNIKDLKGFVYLNYRKRLICFKEIVLKTCSMYLRRVDFFFLKMCGSWRKLSIVILIICTWTRFNTVVSTF